MRGGKVLGRYLTRAPIDSPHRKTIPQSPHMTAMAVLY